MSDTGDPTRAEGADEPENAASGEPEDVATLPEMAKVVLWDGVIGAVAGAGGNVVMLGTLLVANQLGGFDFNAMTVVADILGLDAVLSGNGLFLAGLVLFLVGGLTIFPLLLVTLGSFLPGRRYATRGLVFGAIVWTGFVLAYNVGFEGVNLAVYVALTFLAHLGYGFVTGWLLDTMFSEEGRPYITASIIAPTAWEDGAPDRDPPLDEDEEVSG